MRIYEKAVSAIEGKELALSYENFGRVVARQKRWNISRELRGAEDVQE
jgi:hypothetical protein